MEHIRSSVKWDWFSLEWHLLDRSLTNVQKKRLKTHVSFFTLFLLLFFICVSEMSGFITDPLFKYTGHESSLWQVLMAFTMTESHPTTQSLLLVRQREMAIKYTKYFKIFPKRQTKMHRDKSCQHTINPEALSSLNLRSGNRIAKNRLNKHESGIRNKDFIN